MSNLNSASRTIEAILLSDLKSASGRICTKYLKARALRNDQS